MSQLELSEQEIIRRNSLQKIREAGIDPYPAEQYHVNITTSRYSQQNILVKKVKCRMFVLVAG